MIKTEKMNRDVRVRFAPSPTGPLHIGGVRTALFNYLFARKHNGKFILRIEDTDSNRFVPGAEEYIIESLKWCGIKIDEGVGSGEKSEISYRQSERRSIYKKFVDELLLNNWAYIAFDTQEALEKLRKERENTGVPFIYNHTTRKSLDNSLNISQEECLMRIESGEQYVVRFKVPKDATIRINDLIRGDVEFNTSTLDDKVIYKSIDGLPTYHLANVVDDHLMDISHVIRGEEWLPSLPLHVLLYHALRFDDTMPQFAHLPLVLKPEGSGKLSKRDGDKFGFPVFPLKWIGENSDVTMGYDSEGYLPEAFVNMIALLGWNPGDNREILSMEEMIESFSISRISKSGARFNPEKPKWFQTQYMHTKSTDYIEKLIMDKFPESYKTRCIVSKAAALIKDRIIFPSDIEVNARYFFMSPSSLDETAINKFWKSEDEEFLRMMLNHLQNAEDSSEKDYVHDVVMRMIKDSGQKTGKIMNLIRLFLVGNSSGVGVFDIIDAIGLKETCRRIDNGIKMILNK